ncbi:MAG: AtpZ/AtpI family protein [Acidimicrobiales bacterium]
MEPGGFRPAVALLTLGLSAAVAVALVGALGYLVDRWVGTSPVFTVIGLALGVLTAVVMTITQVRRYL